jgi:DNA-binding transcriptional regulator YdaS (Cro superfamily)
MTDVQPGGSRNPIALRRAPKRELAARGGVSVAELSQMPDASPATMRRIANRVSHHG